MENLSHSFSKKSYGGNGFGMASHGHKSVYDDVFGGPPKFGMPTLAPRLEDYSEIFGGFHSARGSSIPILDLPVVEEAELCCDVQSSRFDYSEVFGGFNGLDVSVSFEDLVRKAYGGDDPSDDDDDDTWTPAHSNSLSDESDPSVCSERSHSLANANICNEASGIRQFDISYHKANQRSNDEVSNVTTHRAELCAMPGHTYAIDEMHASQKVEGSKLQEASDLKSSVDFGGGAAEDEQFKNNVSVPKKCAVGTSESHAYRVEKSDGHFFSQSRPFVTVNDINLRTKPSRLPPPSRPPPVFASDKPNSKLKASKTCGLEQEDDSWPSFYDVEVDGNSSMMASATLRDAMQKAQAKIRSAKESMEKKEVLQSSLKLHSQTDIKEEKLSKTFDSSKDDRVQEKSAKQDSGIKLLAEEERYKIKMNQELSDLVEREGSTDLAEKPAKRRYGKHSSSSNPVLYNSEGNFAWRQGTEYFEVFEAHIPLAFEHNRDDNVLFQMDLDEFKHSVATETTEQLGGGKEFKAAEIASKLEDQNITFEVVAETFGERLRSETTAGSSCQTQSGEKAHVGVSYCESEVSKGKMKMAKQHEDSRKIGNVTNNSGQMNTKADLHVSEVEAKSHLRGVSEGPDTDKIAMDVHARKPNDRRSRENFEMNYCAGLDKVGKQDGNEKGETNQDEKKKQQEEYHESQKDERKQKEVCGRKENQKLHKEVVKSEDAEKRLKGAAEHAENEKDFKKSFEKSENKKSQELDCLVEKDNGNLREASNLVDSDDFELTPSYDHEDGQSDACEPGKGEVKVEEVEEQEDNNNGSNMVFVEDVEDVSMVANASEKSIHVSEEAGKHEEFCGHAKDAEQSMRDDKDKQGNLDQVTNLPMERENIKAFGETGKLTDEMNAPFLPGKLDKNCGELETIQESFSYEENDFPTGAKDGELGLHQGAANLLVENKSHSFGKIQNELRCQKLEKGTVDVNNCPYLHEHGIDSNEAGTGIENSSLQEKEVSRRACDPEITAVASHEQGWRVKMNNGVQITINKESLKDNVRPCQPCMWADNVQVIGAGLSTVREDRENGCNAGQRCGQNVERKEKNLNETVAQEDDKIAERLQREREELLRKMEEEREREREREKDRMAVDKATLEARDRSYAEARGRAERAAVERPTAEVRQRAMSVAREKLEKASFEARERSVPDKASVEARIRAERAAVERATLEARQRAFEKAMADKVSFEARERVERSVSDKYSASSKTVEMRQSSSFHDLPDFQSQSAGTSNVLRYSYSTAHAGLEGESPQRCKARLERYRRTAERAAKALAEKNMRDLLAQREQAERNRLAESLDAEVKRWSSGKEGNLRALLSTLQYILGPDCGWQPIPLTEVITSAAVKKAYRKATLCVHPDKLQQRGASIQQKYICEKVFDLLKEAWNTFNSEEW
ncbi:unnamed protein product [Coffea canephora]|uniref:J domain-containing protein n=1 Tax=Coffea canephora TaxID=49390 RepID=A0A068U1E3_COFCA|nr:unnamed protein product [Coffea canephora]